MSVHKLEEIKNRLQNREAQILGHRKISKAAVLLPLVEKDGELQVLFEVRAQHLRRQPGEICFPGGRVDPTDVNEEYAAVRETCEELGLERSQVESYASLDILVTPFNTIIYPFVGKIEDSASIRPSPDEVEEVFYVPLDYFFSTQPERHDVHLNINPAENFPFHLISGGKYYKWRAGKVPEYFYTYNDRIIWGLTARILNHFVTLLQQD